MPDGFFNQMSCQELRTLVSYNWTAFQKDSAIQILTLSIWRRDGSREGVWLSADERRRRRPRSNGWKQNSFDACARPRQEEIVVCASERASERASSGVCPRGN